ncbi:DUF2167 domain-containing protein [Hyalangium minutum]|uniref:Putative inner membrane protein n=1 Tax=Hyalangium minutum TaxID=394096 RepID=A0A085WJQ9_9BACT|nr:DUF2167 domain-containing protein [Hyalangium minutum]KFE67922.1 putative inner membrane protein [Hyalangium minutum]
MHAGWKWIAAGLLLTPLLALADLPPPKSDDLIKELEQGEMQEAEAPEEIPPGVKPGPVKVDLGHELALDVPDDHVFLDKPVAAKVLEQNGSFHHDNLLGIVVSKDEQAPWFVVIRYEDEGYIKDDEALDSKEILDAIKEGQEEANEERVQRGFKALRIGDWTEAPHYDRAQHHLVWALNASTEDGTSVNYNTRVLGRRGFVSLNLVVNPENLELSKPHVVKLLKNTSFNQGARYADFQEGTDKVAEYGLAGIVLGGAGLGAAKLVKVGLLAKASKFIIALLLAGKKFIVLALVGLGALLKKIFGGKDSSGNP